MKVYSQLSNQRVVYYSLAAFFGLLLLVLTILIL
jgi:hypothetical protein